MPDELNRLVDRDLARTGLKAFHEQLAVRTGFPKNILEAARSGKEVEVNDEELRLLQRLRARVRGR